jgi:VIT1/CCC1 family predicted Fe2+/Mn2+ transporter
MSESNTSVDASIEPHQSGLGQRLNWLRAGVLGANDGIVSIAGLVVGVAAATPDRPAILAAGIAGMVAGATSMALGEYVSVSTQRDTERALLDKERFELDNYPDAELE